MGGYNASEKDTIATNLNLYTKAGADARFAALETCSRITSTFDRARKIPHGSPAAPAEQVGRAVQRRNRQGLPAQGRQTFRPVLADSGGETAGLPRYRSRLCGRIPALLADTGWMHMENSGSGTDTQGLFIRQIGNIVSIQGYINTARRDGSNWGGIVAVIPNKIQPPRYSVRCSAADWNDDHKYNRGSSFTIYGGSRRIQLYERGMYNVNVELNFTYFV